MPPTSDTILEVDLGALAHNYRFIRSRIKPETRLLGVVKAFAYGSEALAIARKLEDLGADYLAVAYTEEGVYLRKGGVRLPIMVLHPQPAGFQSLIAHCLEPALYAPRILKLFMETLEELNQKGYPVHLKFNTGLNRLGFWENDLEWIAAQIKNKNCLEVRSVFSHLAAPDDREQEAFTLRQIEGFKNIVTQYETLFSGPVLKHLLNTSGILTYPDAQWDMVRCGIGLYGYSNDFGIDAKLKAVTRLKTRISQIHKIEPGEWVGYNKGYVAPDYRTTATLPIGHADGIGRQYGKGKGFVWVGGKKAPIIGNVCMDMLMVDVSGIDCREGDEVVLFGNMHSAELFAKGAQTISYELLAGISQRVPRVLLEAD